MLLITATSFRPNAFSLLEKCMAKQSLKWKQWVVICDNEQYARHYRMTLGQTFLFLNRAKPPSWHSMNWNLWAAMPFMTKHKQFAIIEDDDWYSPTYLEKLSDYLQEGELAGFAPARYYHTGNRAYMTHVNYEWASLGATGFTGAVIPLFQELVEKGNPYIDDSLWQRWEGKKCLKPNNHHVGFKDGRGIGIGHLLTGPVDTDGAVLRQWIGSDGENYITIKEDLC